MESTGKFEKRFFKLLENMTAGAYLDERLREIGLKK